MALKESLMTLFRGGRPIKVDTGILPELETASLQNIIELLVSLRELSGSYEDKLLDFKRIAQDSVGGSAISLIADDVCQQDDNSHESLWVEALDSVESVEAVKWLNAFIKDRKIDDLMWPITYNVIRDGGCIVKTYFSELTEMGKDKKPQSVRNKLGYIFDIEEDYHSVSELMRFGDTVGFYKDSDKKAIVYPKDDFIHFCNDRRGDRQKVKLRLQGLDADSQERETEFTIRRGLSQLEPARSAFRVLEVMELILVAARLGRSQLYRLVQIEVGNADKNETAKLLRDFKTKLAAQESIDVQNGSYAASLKPIPHGQNIYIPTRNGKGQVSIDLVGGDYDLREIIDIEYFRNKFYAGLQVPKAYLGLEEALPGGIGDTSLTRLDIRYGRKIKRLKAVIESGMTDLLNFVCGCIGKSSWKNKFLVRTSQLITAEENDRYESFKTRSEFVDALGNLLSDVPGFSRRKYARVVSREILQIGDLYDKVVDEGTPDDSDSDSEYREMGVEGNPDDVSPAGEDEDLGGGGGRLPSHGELPESPETDFESEEEPLDQGPEEGSQEF